MKNYFLLLVMFSIVCIQESYSQTNIYKQDFNNNGTPVGWRITTDAWTVANSNSNGYEGASGGNALRATYMVGGHSVFTSIIPTKNYKEIAVIWAEKRPYNFDLDVEFSWSLDFGNWNTVQYEKSSGEDNWQLVNNAQPIKLNEECWDRDTIYFRWKFIGPISFFNRQMFLDDIVISGISKLVTIEEETSFADYRLYQNYPNPFNSTTIIYYTIPIECDIAIEVYDISGRTIKSTIQHKMPGSYSENISMNGFASGIYFYKMQTIARNDLKQFMMVKKMILMK